MSALAAATWSSTSSRKWIATSSERSGSSPPNATTSEHHWSDCAVERIERYRDIRDLPAGDVRVLAYGDGPGSDSLLLASRGYRVDYFDVPGSRTFAFALERFQRHGFLGTEIEVREQVDADGPGEPGANDVVVCFEVLEHLTDPSAAIALIARALKAGGIALITHRCRVPDPSRLQQPVRRSNAFMCLKESLRLTWYRDEPLFKPMEYQKADVRRLRDAVRLLATPAVARKLVVRQGRWLVGLTVVPTAAPPAGAPPPADTSRRPAPTGDGESR